MNTELIKSIILGAVSIEADENAVSFKRMKPEQKAAFIAEDEGFALKTDATAGVRFDFYTNSKHISFKYEMLCGSSRNFGFFDVLVNGTLYMHTGTTDVANNKYGELNIELNGQNNKVQIFFPNLANGRVLDFTLDDGATVTPCKPETKILFFGDSITQGYDALFSSCSYANRLGINFNAEVVNQAIGGATFNKNVVAKTIVPSFIVIGYGTNDWSHKGEKESLLDADEFYKAVRTCYPDTPAFSVLPIWRADTAKETKAGNFYAWRKLLSETAAKHNIVAVESIDFVPHDTVLFSDAYLHPNDQGFYLYAAHLTEKLKELL